MRNVAYLVAITHAHEIAEAVLDDGQVVEVVQHPVRQAALVAEPDDPLLRPIRLRPVDLERDLVGADEDALVDIAAVEVEVDQAFGTAHVIGECGIREWQCPALACALDESQCARAVPCGISGLDRGCVGAHSGR